MADKEQYNGDHHHHQHDGLVDVDRTHPRRVELEELEEKPAEGIADQVDQEQVTLSQLIRELPAQPQ